MKKNKKNSQSCFVNFVNLDFVLSFFSMKFSLLLLLLVITCCLIDDSEGWGRRRWRVRRVFKAVCNTVCRIKCVKSCPLCTPVWGRVCGKFCGRKRSEVGTFPYHTIYHHRDSVTLTYLYMYSFDIRIFKVIYTLPCDFVAWDKNGDGHIDIKEFSTVAYVAVEEGELALAFEATDTDGLSTHQWSTLDFVYQNKISKLVFPWKHINKIVLKMRILSH